jgi:hypothetical protein
VGIRCADHATPSIRKSWHYLPTSGERLVGIVGSRTKATEFSLVLTRCMNISYGVSHERSNILLSAYLVYSVSINNVLMLIYEVKCTV